MGQFSISVLQQLSTDFWIFVSLPSRFRLSSTASDAAPRHTSFFYCRRIHVHIELTGVDGRLSDTRPIRRRTLP